MSAEPKTYLPATLSEVGSFAKVAADSRMFGGNEAELCVKLMAGAAWGVPPMAALSDVHVVKGKPMASGTLLRAMIRQHPDYDYRIVEHTDERAVIEFLRVLPSGDREVLGVTDFDIARAKRQGLTSNRLYQTAPRNMLLARATSDGVKTHCPDVFVGSIYAEGEIEDDRDPIQLPPQRAEPQRSARTGAMVGQPSEERPTVRGEGMPRDPEKRQIIPPAEAQAMREQAAGVIEVLDRDGVVVNSAQVPPLEGHEVEGGLVVQVRPAPAGVDAERWAAGIRSLFKGCGSWDEQKLAHVREQACGLDSTAAMNRLWGEAQRPAQAGGVS